MEISKEIIFDNYPDQKVNQSVDRNIQEISDNRVIALDNENFFNHKKKRWVFAWVIAFAIIILISSKYLFSIGFIDFFRKLSDVGQKPYFVATLSFGFATFFVCEVFIRVKVLKEKLGLKIKHVSRIEWFNFSVISFIIQSITPFSIGSEPYTIWWLNKKGVSFREASAAVAVTSVCWFLGQFLITWPSFIYITCQNWEKISTLKISTTYWLILAGLFTDIVVSVFIFMISYVRKAHYFISRVLNSIKKYFGLQYLTHDEIFQCYLKQSNFQSMYKKYLFSWSTIRVIGWFLFNNIWVYGLFVIIHRLFNESNWDFYSTINSYNLINVATTSTNFVPLPSAEGSLQAVINSLLKGIPVLGSSSSQTTTDNTLNEGTVILWRFFCKYFGFCLAISFILIFGLNNNSNRFKRFKLFKKKDPNVQQLTF